MFANHFSTIQLHFVSIFKNAHASKSLLLEDQLIKIAISEINEITSLVRTYFASNKTLTVKEKIAALRHVKDLCDYFFILLHMYEGTCIDPNNLKALISSLGLQRALVSDRLDKMEKEGV